MFELHEYLEFKLLKTKSKPFKKRKLCSENIYLYLCEISDNNNSAEIHIRIQLIPSVDYIMTNHIFL